MSDNFQILRDFVKSNNKPDKDIYQFVKEVLDMNSAYAKENTNLKEQNKKLEDNWNELKEYVANNLYFYSGYQGEDLELDNAIQGVIDKIVELKRGVSDE